MKGHHLGGDRFRIVSFLNTKKKYALHFHPLVWRISVALAH